VAGLCAISRTVRGRWRTPLALAGVLLVLGVVALDAHAALPEHHHSHGEATICVAALAIATLGALGWALSRAVAQMPPLRAVPPVRRRPIAPPARVASVAARAGPGRSPILRR
jgi:hypothetical protein